MGKCEIKRSFHSKVEEKRISAIWELGYLGIWELANSG